MLFVVFDSEDLISFTASVLIIASKLSSSNFTVVGPLGFLFSSKPVAITVTLIAIPNSVSMPIPSIILTFLPAAS